MFSIGDLAKRSGVSLRTLRHYNAIGLLIPAARGDNNYRYYTESDLYRLHQILFYRALGLSLQEVAGLLDQAPPERLNQLRVQREQLDSRIKQLEKMREQIDQLLEESKPMKSTNLFSMFENFDPDQYTDEVESRWGATDAYEISSQRCKNYSAEDWTRFKAESEALNGAIADCMAKRLPPADDRVLAVVEQMRLQIDQWFYPCSRQMHASLGEMYVLDERFTATYEKIRPGMAKYLRDAIVANLMREKPAQG